jgi:hypothetical protein
MALTKVSYSMIQGAPANVLDFGADPTGAADSTAAFIAAVAASDAVFIPEGTFKITDTIHIDRNGVNIFGNGDGSVINFAPTVSPAKLFLIQAADPANLIQFVNFYNFGVKALFPSAIVKQAFTFVDASHIIVENINTLDYSWVDSGTNDSIFFTFAGRDQHTISNCYVAAGLPIYVTKNPNSAQYQFDVFTFENLSLEILNPSNYAITFDVGVNISQWTMLGRNIALKGKGGIYFNDTETGTLTSSMILIDSFRVESGPGTGAGDAGGYGIYMNFGASNPDCGNIVVRNSSVNDPLVNGYHFENVSALQVQNINCGFGASNNAFILQNVGNAEIVALGIAQDTATVLFSNMYQELVVKFFGVSLTNPSVAYGRYTYYDVDSPSRLRVYQNGVRTWQRKQVMANTNTMSLPILASGDSMLVNVSCDFGYGLYGVRQSSATLLFGTAGFGVAGSGDISLVSNSGSPYLINNTAGSQLVFVTTSGA